MIPPRALMLNGAARAVHAAGTMLGPVPHGAERTYSNNCSTLRYATGQDHLRKGRRQSLCEACHYARQAFRSRQGPQPVPTTVGSRAIPGCQTGCVDSAAWAAQHGRWSSVPYRRRQGRRTWPPWGWRATYAARWQFRRPYDDGVAGLELFQRAGTYRAMTSRGCCAVIAHGLEGQVCGLPRAGRSLVVMTRFVLQLVDEDVSAPSFDLQVRAPSCVIMLRRPLFSLGLRLVI